MNRRILMGIIIIAGLGVAAFGWFVYGEIVYFTVRVIHQVVFGGEKSYISESYVIAYKLLYTLFCLSLYGLVILLIDRRRLTRAPEYKKRRIAKLQAKIERLQKE